MHLKVRFADFSLITRSQTLPEPTDITDELWRAADELLCQQLPAGHPPVRLVGMGVSGLDDAGAVQGLLFDQEDQQKQSRLDAVASRERRHPNDTAAAKLGDFPGADVMAGVEGLHGFLGFDRPTDVFADGVFEFGSFVRWPKYDVGSCVKRLFAPANWVCEFTKMYRYQPMRAE